MSFSETIFLFLLALIIFGPKKLPEIARQVGKYLNEFKRASNEFKAQIEQEISHLEDDKSNTILPPRQQPQGAMSRSSSVTIESSSEAPATLAAADVAAPGEETSRAALPPPEPPPVATEAVTPDSVAGSTSQESHA
jgi:sec-independent protein translocase protein TatB